MLSIVYLKSLCLVLTDSSRLVGKCPNTYAYTKAIAEQLLREEHGDIPLAIVRPSTVTAAFKEPMPGWIDNINGPTGLSRFLICVYFPFSFAFPLRQEQDNRRRGGRVERNTPLLRFFAFLFISVFLTTTTKKNKISLSLFSK